MKKSFLLIPALLFLVFNFVSAQNGPCMSGVTYYEITEALKTPTKVQVLDLAMQSPTKLTTLPSSIGKLINLECLDVSFNRIASLPSEMKNLNKLKVLNLSGNRYLAKLPEVIKQISSLEVLDLTGIPEWSKAKCDAVKKALPNVKVLTDK